MLIKPLKYRLALVHKLLFHPFVHPDFPDSLKKRNYMLQQMPVVPPGPRLYLDGPIATKHGCFIETNNEKKLIAVDGTDEKFVEIMNDLISIAQEDYNVNLESDLDSVTDYKFQDDALIEFIMENPDYQPDDEEPDYDPDEYITWDEALLADLIVRVYAQDEVEFEDYSVEYSSEKSDDSLELKDTPVDETLIVELDGSEIVVYAANSNAALLLMNLT